jgi:hypothetical protein
MFVTCDLPERSLGQEAQVKILLSRLQLVAEVIEGMVQMIAAPIHKVKLKKATVGFGIELVSLLGCANAKGTG